MEELTKEERIKKEINRIKKIFKNVSKETKTLAEGLIKEAAYMRIQLEDYKADLDAKGYVELFTQSQNTPPYERERPVARLYPTANKNYQSIMKQLFDLLPKTDNKAVEKENDDGYAKFVQAKQTR